MPVSKRFSPFIILLVWFSLMANWASALTILINPGTQLTANPDALAAFGRAAQEWSSMITSNVTIYVDADLSSGFSNPNTIGEASYINYKLDGSDINLDYTTVRNAMAVRSTRPGNSILAYLPTTATVTANTPSGTTLVSNTLGVVRANQRVLGLLDSGDTRADGFIKFNSNFAFDYNRADGVASGTVDFQTAAAHELGHILGFLSDVDDFVNFAGTITSDNLTTLDLFRFAAAHKPTTPEEFQTFARELNYGVESVISDVNSNYALSTGSFPFGDGNQASHWKDDSITGYLIGIMDPTLANGFFEVVAPADLRAMELIGYDVVPEPSVTNLLVLGLTMQFVFVRRRKKI